MYKASQEFSFTLRQDENDTRIIGQLIFSSKSINAVGTLYTDEELQSFNDMLNSNFPIPQYWTLETLAKYLFESCRGLFTNLSAVNLYIEDMPERVVEFSKDYNTTDYIDSEVTELEAVA